MNSNKSNEINVPLKKKVLLKNLYWTVNKFKEDPHHKQQNSSRDDLIGGFFDRWINRIPEFLIFDKFLKPTGFSPVVDNFIYTEKTSKNAPDIIGLKDKHDNYFPFAKFNSNRWEIDKDAPFIEMKVFRSTQNLITIPDTQFKPWKYYAIVESYVPDDYLISVFDKDFFENPMFFDEINDEKIRKNFSNGELGLYAPQKLSPSSNLGGFKLLGIYKGSILEYYGKYIPPKDEHLNSNDDPISPLYLKNEPCLFTYDNAEKLDKGFFRNYFYETCSIPVIIKKCEDSEITLIYSSKFFITINVEGTVLINNKEFSDGDYDLFFKPIFRNCVKYYCLEKVEPNKKLNVEKDLVLNSGLLLHYGEKQYFIDCSIEIDDSSSLYSVVLTKSYIILKINGSVDIDGEEYGSGLHKFEFISHSDEKTRENLIYRMLSDGEEKINLKGIRKYSRYTVSIPEGQYDFNVEFLENPEFDYSNVCFKVLNSTSEIIEKTSKSLIIDVGGKIKFAEDGFDRPDSELPKGLHCLKIGSLNKKFLIKDYEKDIDHPLYNSNAIDLKDYLNYENESYGIFDLELIENININNSNDADENDPDKNKKVFIPISIKLHDNSTLKVHEKNYSKMIISIQGSAEINSFPINGNSDNISSKNFYKLEFGTFKRSSKKREFILSKKALESSNVNSELELLNHIKKFTQKFS